MVGVNQSVCVYNSYIRGITYWSSNVSDCFLKSNSFVCVLYA